MRIVEAVDPRVKRVRSYRIDGFTSGVDHPNSKRVVRLVHTLEATQVERGSSEGPLDSRAVRGQGEQVDNSAIGRQSVNHLLRIENSVA